MIHASKLHTIRVLFAAALAMAGCSGTSGGQIPCIDDASCPNDYPVCGPAGKCIAGTSTSSTSVAVVGAEGHTPADFLSGTVRVLVTARASSGVQSVKLAVGSTNFSASATPATPPLYAFDVDTTKLPNADASLTATLAAGDGSSATASGTLHVDNAKPVITTFTVAGAPTTTITAGKVTAIFASFTGGVSATITSTAGGSVSIANGGSVLVSPDVLTSYSLRVTSRSGVSVQSGSTGQPPDVSVSVAQPASFNGNFTVDRTVIDFGDTGTLAFTAPTFPGGFTAVVNDGSGASKGAITSGGTLPNVAVPAMTATTTQLLYTLVINNGATIPDTVSIPLIVKVRPKISTFAFQSNGTNAATFNPGDDVVLNYNYSGATGGSAKINGVDAPTPGPITFANIQASTVYTLTVTNSAGTSVPATATATVRPKIYSFAVGATQSTATSSVTISNGDTTNLFASFAGSGASGSAAGTVSCATSCSGTLTSGTSIASGVALGVTGNANGSFVYTLTVSPSSGASVTASATIKVVPAAHATSLTAGSSMIHNGARTILTPVFDFGTSPVVPGSATITGSDGSRYANLASGTAINIAPSATTTYTLNVFNAAGAQAAAPAPTTTVTVALGTWTVLNTDTGAVENGKRLGVTVTPLGGGKVLIAGGMNGTTPLNTARVCDASGACNATKTAMVSARAYHTAVVIDPLVANNGGKILLMGGYTASGPATPTTSAEFYDPTTNSFTDTTVPITTGTVTSARARHVAVLLSDGKTVLVAGGNDGNADLNSAIKYDAGTNPTPSTANISGTMAQARASFTGTLLASGKVLAVGGKASDVTAELFDPTGNTFGSAGSLPTGEDKRSHTAVRITGIDQTNDVLISGGVTGTNTQSATQVLYDPNAGTFTKLTAAPLGTARSNHAAIALSIDVLICGGTTNGTDTISSCELYHPTSGLQLPTPSMIEGRKDFGLATITLSSINQIFASGGTASPPGTYAETYEPN